MTRWFSRPTVALGIAAACIAAVLFALSVGHRPRAPSAAKVRGAAEHFFRLYVDRNGRVVRRDQGGDTVSEGQAYALLIAVGVGDRRRFDAVWRWTRTHLQRRDGLLSWHWQNGRVTDRQSAADADADAARALALAARRFHSAAYGRAAARIAAALLAEETVVAGGRRVTLGGPWARTPPYAVNPSYFSPVSDAVLARATHDARLRALTVSQRAVLAALTRQGTALPPDWARVRPDGTAAASTALNGSAPTPRYGLDAVRVAVRLAESCAHPDRAAAARIWTLLARGGRPGLQPRALAGAPLPGAFRHPASLVGAAAAAAAARHPAVARRLLAEAARLDGQHPSYYGAAWVALGRLMLTTRALGGCPPLASR